MPITDILFKLGTETMRNGFKKIHLAGLELGFEASIHQISEPDYNSIHSHHASFFTHILNGWYDERIYILNPTSAKGYTTRIMRCLPGTSHFIAADTIHEIIEVAPQGCTTIITPIQDLPRATPQFWEFRLDGIYSRPWNVEEWTRYEPQRP